MTTERPVVRLLDCVDLVRRFGERTAVDQLSFHIDRGETYGLLGPNGSGKTTTISIVAGVLRADAGTVTIGGRPIGVRASETKGAIGLVPQEVALYDDLTATENLRFFGRLQGLGGKQLERRIAEVLETVGLTTRSRDRVEDYSGGMKRRANIAVGLLHQPQLLILDEPTVGVDPQSRNQILESIEVLGGEGLSVLYTTHYMEEAERLCDRLAILDEGRMIAEGTRRELVARVGEHDLLSVSLAADEEARARFAEQCRDLAGVLEARVRDERIEILTADADAVLPAVVAAAGAAQLALSSVSVHEPNLEAVFLQLTGRALRD